MGGVLNCGGVEGWTDLQAYPLIFGNWSNGTFRPGLATSWEVSSGNTVATFTLRRGVRFADGTPFDASTVKTWWDFLRTKGSAIAAAALGRVQSTKVISKYVVRITLKAPNPDILSYFVDNFLFSTWGQIESPKAVAKADASSSHQLPTGTHGVAPYVYDPSQSVAGSTCTYLPDRYFYDQSEIHWGKIVSRLISDGNTALNALKTGQIDVVPYADWRFGAAARAAGFNVLNAPGQYWFIALWDHGKLNPALGDVRVRQALNYAIDRQALNRAFLGPYAKPTSSPDPSSNGSVAKYDNYYSYDPAKAKSLLAAAGYAHGFKFSIINLGPWAGTTFDTYHICQAVAAELDAVGVRTTCTPTPTGGIFTTGLNSKTYDAFFYQDFSRPFSSWYSAYMISGANNPGVGFPDQHGATDLAVQRLWQEAQGLSPEKAAPIWRQALTRVITDAWDIPVGYQPTQTWFSNKVGGIVGRPFFGTNNPVDWFPTGK
jgi:peptide/nickel transport system substrate-binding protein